MDVFAYYLTGFIIVPVIIFSMICQAKVNSNFKKYGRIPNSRSITGAQAAAELLRLNGITDVGIRMIPGKLTDNYNPTTKMISLSEAVYNSQHCRSGYCMPRSGACLPACAGIFSA